MAQVLDHLTVMRDGMHNAFTDLVWWRGAYWVTYRKAHWHHLDPTSEVVVACSPERRRWREVARLKVAGDCRDPRFAVLGETRLAVLFPVLATADTPQQVAALAGRIGDDGALQYVAFSDDGFNWLPPQRILPPRHHVFRLVRRDGVFHGLDIIREHGLSRVELATSQDLLQWSRVTQIGPTEMMLNEADIIFRPDGEAWLIARTTRKPLDDAVFGRSRPPYTHWDLTDLGLMIHAPAMMEHEGEVYVAGRSNPRRAGCAAWPFGNSLGVWRVSPGRVDLVMHLPATGDCSYPALLKDPSGNILMSYYSQHAYHMGVLPPFAGKVAENETPWAKVGCAADIYLSQLALP